MDESLIKEEMVKGVCQYFTVSELRKVAEESIEIKVREGMPFGRLTFIHHAMFGGILEDIHRVCSAVELMMLALDIFDDLQDQDNRQLPWNQADPAIAMNLAIGLQALSYQQVQDTQVEVHRKWKAIQYLNKAVLTSVNGQHLDILNSMKSEEDYLTMARLKSGALVKAACMIGSAMATEDHLDTVDNYSEHIGIAAQIQNDIKDVFRWDEKNDIFQKKKTLPIIYFLKSSNPQFDIIRDYYNGKLSKEAIQSKKLEILELIKTSGAIEYANVWKRIHQLKAIDQINSLPSDQKWREILIEII